MLQDRENRVRFLMSTPLTMEIIEEIDEQEVAFGNPEEGFFFLYDEAILLLQMNILRDLTDEEDFKGWYHVDW